MRGHVNVRPSVSFDGQSNVNVAVVCADDPEKVTVVTSVYCGPDSALHAERDRSRTGGGINAETDRVADRSSEVNRHPEE